MTKLGILTFPPSLREMVQLARDADDAGFDSVWTGEYFCRNAFTTLSAMALATRRIAIGSAIAYAFVRSPVQLAMAAADVDELSDGRLLLGLGAGTRMQNEQWFGVPFGAPSAKVGEILPIARGLWSHKEGAFSYQGRYYQLSIPNFARVSQARDKIPVYLGAVGPRMLKLAGASADGFIGHPTYTRSYYRKAVLPLVEQEMRQAGRRTGEVERALTIVTIINRDSATARYEAAKRLTFYYVARPFHAILDFHGWEQEKQAILAAWRSVDPQRAADAISARMRDEVLVLAGNPDEVRRQWKELDGLADHVLLLAPAPYDGLGFDAYAENYQAILELFGRNKTGARTAQMVSNQP